MLPAKARGKQARKRTATQSAVIRRGRDIMEKPCREFDENWLHLSIQIHTLQQLNNVLQGWLASGCEGRLDVG
jgi:hypothetical protein